MPIDVFGKVAVLDERHAQATEHRSEGAVVQMLCKRGTGNNSGAAHLPVQTWLERTNADVIVAFEMARRYDNRTAHKAALCRRAPIAVALMHRFHRPFVTRRLPAWPNMRREDGGRRPGGIHQLQARQDELLCGWFELVEAEVVCPHDLHVHGALM